MLKNNNVDSVIKNHMKKWRIKDFKKIYISNIRVEKREIDEVWLDGDGQWNVQKNGYVLKSSNHPSISSGNGNEKLFTKCVTCGKRVINNKINENQIEVMNFTGNCYKCNSEKELNELLENGEIDLKGWMKTASFTDSYGNLLIDEEEIRQEYGEELYQEVKTKHLKNIQKLKSKNKINE